MFFEELAFLSIATADCPLFLSLSLLWLILQSEEPYTSTLREDTRPNYTYTVPYLNHELHILTRMIGAKQIFSTHRFLKLLRWAGARAATLAQ
jgi:hypothetical protein